MAKVFKILSIDGGGIRGLIPAMVLTEIEKRTGQPISQLFDLIAGTSTGGILSLGMVVPGKDGAPRYSARDSIGFYENEGPKIFRDSLWQTVKNLTDEKYPSDVIDDVLERYFGNAMLGDALTDIMITSYDIERRIPWFFRSSRAATDPEYNFPMRWVARSTAAAPTYFETARVSNWDSSDYFPLIDGGVFANNPTMCAYVDALRHYIGYDGFLIVSLGTGEYTTRIPYNDAKDWGLASWVKPVIDIMMHGVNETVDYQMRTLFPVAADGSEQYFRFQVRLDNTTNAMDNASVENMRAVRLLAEREIGEQNRAIGVLCDRLLET
jgi:patatin-like phospholipase/acyl hydrolase